MVGLSKLTESERLRERFGGALQHVAFKLPGGSQWPDNAPRRATIVLKHDGSLRALLKARSDKTLAELFLRDDLDIEGDIEAVLEIVDVLRERLHEDWLARFVAAAEWSRGHGASPRPAWHGARGPTWSRHTRERDRRAVSFHYDLPPEFFRLWLDRLLVYSCAYFEEPSDDIDTAQLAKLRHICHKLRLHPGQRLIDLGCGWGGLVRYAAREHNVRATGITLSARQAALAETLVGSDGLGDCARIECADYRDLREVESYDAVVSIGMSEHVGRENLAAYFSKIAGLLKPGGVCLNQAISEGIRPRAKFGASFIDEYVFPDTDIPPLPLVLTAAENAGMEVRDVENLREHYSLTLRRWRRRLEENHEAARRWIDEPTYRVWRLYLAASARGFECSELAVYQLLLSRPTRDGRSALPLTRTDWFP